MLNGKTRSELYEEVERIFQGLKNIEVSIGGHRELCKYKTFINRCNMEELKLIYNSYDPKRIESVIEKGFKMPELPELIFGPNSNTREYAKIGLEIIENLIGLKLPRNTPYTIIQAVLKEPQALLK